MIVCLIRICLKVLFIDSRPVMMLNYRYLSLDHFRLATVHVDFGFRFLLVKLLHGTRLANFLMSDYVSESVKALDWSPKKSRFFVVFSNAAWQC